MSRRLEACASFGLTFLVCAALNAALALVLGVRWLDAACAFAAVGAALLGFAFYRLSGGTQ